MKHYKHTTGGTECQELYAPVFFHEEQATFHLLAMLLGDKLDLLFNRSYHLRLKSEHFVQWVDCCYVSSLDEEKVLIHVAQPAGADLINPSVVLIVNECRELAIPRDFTTIIDKTVVFHPDTGAFDPAVRHMVNARLLWWFSTLLRHGFQPVEQIPIRKLQLTGWLSPRKTAVAN